MPAISTFMYCEQVVVNDGKMQVENPLNIIKPGYIPGNYSFSVFFSILGVSEESLHSIQLLFLDQDGEVLVETQKVTIDGKYSADSHLPPELQGITAGFDFKNVKFNKNGVYTTEIYFDDEKLDEFPIAVKGVERA